MGPGTSWERLVKVDKFCKKSHYGDGHENYQNSHNSANFQARTSIFCMEVDLDNIKGITEMMMLMIMMIMMIKMIMIIIAVIQSTFKLGPPDFVWKWI